MGFIELIIVKWAYQSYFSQHEEQIISLSALKFALKGKICDIITVWRYVFLIWIIFKEYYRRCFSIFHIGKLIYILLTTIVYIKMNKRYHISLRLRSGIKA